jgi:hypothetical protein
LITTIDDHSRRILYAELEERETSWAHIVAAKAVAMRFGCASKYYPDSHSIFRYVEKRDSVHRKFEATEEGAFVQWKEVMKDLSVEVVYALSPQAKGKVERPYRWLQDHLVRTCFREKVRKIGEAREILVEEVHRYNHERVHSTTGEIPVVRFGQAVHDGRDFFRTARIPVPYETWDDIFCYRYQRVSDPYRHVSWQGVELAPHVDPRTPVELRVSFDLHTRIAKVRMWSNNRLVGEQLVKADEISRLHF